VKQFKTVLLSLLIVGLLPLPLLAEGEDDLFDTESESTVATNHLMLRHISEVKGYQALTVAGVEIDAAYIEETLGEQYGAVILLHDQGEQFESHGVITPLRHSLPEYGWSTLTLSFDFPYEPNILLSATQKTADVDAIASEDLIFDDEVDKAVESKEPAAKPSELPAVSNQERIQAALSFLQDKGAQRIIFIGHGAGADLAIELLDTIKTPVSALILVGSTALPKNDIFNEFNFPIFDVYGANDLDAVPAAVKHRKVVMKRVNNTRYQSRRIIGADHIFSGLQATLTTTVSGWLRSKFIEQEDH